MKDTGHSAGNCLKVPLRSCLGRQKSSWKSHVESLVTARGGTPGPFKGICIALKIKKQLGQQRRGGSVCKGSTSIMSTGLETHHRLFYSQ